MRGADGQREITHRGIVQRCYDDCVVVSFDQPAACAGCHAEGSCRMTGSAGREMEIDGRNDLKPGDEVLVHIKQSAGYRALAFGYLFPAVILLVAVPVLISAGFDEMAAGSGSLLLLLIYYSILYLFRKRIDRKFVFTLNKT